MKMSKNRSFRPILWCQKFRSLRKTAEQSHLEAFISWYRSQEVTIYEQLVQLILMEAFTLGVDRDVASCLAQKRVKTVEKAATVADNYVLARKKSHTFISRSNLPPPRGQVKRPLAPLPQGKNSWKPAPAARPPPSGNRLAVVGGLACPYDLASWTRGGFGPCSAPVWGERASHARKVASEGPD